MIVLLVHHADAVLPSVDHMRPLSHLGRGQADHAATVARQRGMKPVKIWHSGKLRARQTAEIFWRVLNPFASFTAVRGVQPDDDPEVIATALEAEVLDGAPDLLIVGHQPHLGRLLAHLTDSDGEFPAHGCVALERRGEGWVESWRT